MKKPILVMLSTLMAVVALTGCNMFAKANGVILYGEEEEIATAVEKEKKKAELEEEELHKMKMVTIDNREMMILSEETAQSLLEKKLIKEITNQENGTTKAVSSLSKIATGEGLLFTKEASYGLEIENVTIKNEGNLVIGDGRVYADMFLIVPDEDWASLQGTEKSLAILQYDKDPSANGLRYDVEKAQLVRIQD